MKTWKLCVELVGLLALASVTACGADGPLDGRGDSFGGSDAKEDGRYTGCQLTEVVNFVREPTTDSAVLVNQGLHPTAARAVVEYQDGPDGTRGTADDKLIQNLTELDSVDFIGTIALDAMVGAVIDRCEVDLGDPNDTSTATRPYISKTTFGAATGGGWTRNAVEMEATFAVHGVPGPELNAVLSRTNSRGRSRFRRIVNDLEDVFGALTYGDHPYESNWNSDANDLREAVKFVALNIESGRKDADFDDKWFSASTGTDKMEDHYFSTFGGALSETGMLVRARRRIDGDPLDFADPCDTPMRRLLIQTKFRPIIDIDGVKRGGKIDTRTSSNTLCDEKTTKVVETAMWGKSNWDGSLTPLEPILAVYNALKDAGGLADIGAHEGVLLLNPTAALWSERSRFHYDLASSSDTRVWFDNGMDAVQRILDEANASGDPALSGVISAAEAILDDSAVLARAQSLDPSRNFTSVTRPTTWSSSDSRETLDNNRVLADAFNGVFSDFDDLVDDADMNDIVSDVDSAGSDRRVEPYMAFKRATDNSVGNQRAAVTYFERFQVDDQDSAASIAAFQTYCQEQVAADLDFFEDCEAVSANQWSNIGKHLHADMITHSRRMVEAAGTTSYALWFHAFRDHYFGNVSNYGNFMIVTFDWTQAISERIWEQLSPVQRYHGIPSENVFWTTLVQENQVELTAEGPQNALEKKEELQPLIDGNTATDEQKEIYAAATFVLDTYLATEVALAEVSGPTIIGELEDRVANPEGDAADLSHEFGNSTSVAIPDNEPAGVETVVNVSEGFEITGLEVAVDISHTYIGDLRVTLKRGNEEIVLHNQTGGGEDNLVTTYTVDDFNGQQALGDWILHVRDNAGVDTGSINEVSLTFLSGNPETGALRWGPALGSKGEQALEKMTSGNLE